MAAEYIDYGVSGGQGRDKRPQRAGGHDLPMMTPVQQQPTEPFAPWRLATILFLLSFATVVFTIVLFRLLTFFIMPSLFFDLLFIGFPLGALAGAYFFLVSRPSFLKTLWILQGAMLFSILAMLACKHFDYLRAHLFDV